MFWRVYKFGIDYIRSELKQTKNNGKVSMKLIYLINFIYFLYA